MVANEKAMGPFVDFLKSTKVSNKERVRKRELEWQQRNDQVAEDLHEEQAD